MSGKRGKKIVTIGVLTLLLVFNGCNGNGAGSDSGGGSDVDPRDADFDAAYTTLENAWSSISAQNPTAGSSIIFGSLFFQVFATYIEAWDGANSYSYGSITITVMESNGLYIWTYTDTSTGDSHEYRLEWSGSVWEFSWRLNGQLYVSGTISNDGLAGTITFFDETTGDKVFEYVIGPDSGGYDLEIVAASYSGENKTDEVVVRTNIGGASGVWNYTDLYDSSNNDSGSWTPT